ncbi:hypothetical protein DFH07DRAFT_1014712, partial [Mycena maculata]
AKVSVDAGDLSGTQALSHAFSTKPAVDYEYAQLLYDAGSDVNQRNRYGATVAHEITQIWAPQDPAVVARATTALTWFLEHGGSVDIADGDGMTVRHMVTRMKKFAPQHVALVGDVDRERKSLARTVEGCCGLCARQDPAQWRCGRCKKVQYCSPGVRACQKLDWPHHKKTCVKAA